MDVERRGIGEKTTIKYAELEWKNNIQVNAMQQDKEEKKGSE